jgi:hypothetical protein
MGVLKKISLSIAYRKAGGLVAETDSLDSSAREVVESKKSHYENAQKTAEDQIDIINEIMTDTVKAYQKDPKRGELYEKKLEKQQTLLNGAELNALLAARNRKDTEQLLTDMKRLNEVYKIVRETLAAKGSEMMPPKTAVTAMKTAAEYMRGISKRLSVHSPALANQYETMAGRFEDASYQVKSAAPKKPAAKAAPA